MKKIIIAIFALCPLALLAQSGPFTLTGKVEGLKNVAQVYLTYTDGDKSIIDSAKLTDGTFKFGGTVSNICKAQLTTTAPKRRSADPEDMLALYLEKGHIYIAAKDSLKHGVVTGSDINNQYNIYKKLLFANEETLKTILSRWSKIDHKDSTQNKLNEELAALYQKELLQHEALQIQFVKEHPDFDISASVLTEVTGPIIKLAKIEPLYSGLSERVRKTTEGKKLGSTVAIAQATTVGRMALPFSKNDINGKLITLSDFRGKYVFLDFWASWCAPCREENPYVLKAHKQYSDKNFTVLSVSVDKDEIAWKKAIKDDGLTYTQILDRMVNGTTISDDYGIMAIPQNFLIDPSGKIIAKNLHGVELESKLKELL